MKPTLAILLLFLYGSPSAGQGRGDSVWLQTKSKARLYYIVLTGSEGKVYEMGSYLDKGGSGYSIQTTDTLIRQPDGVYLGRQSRIIEEGSRAYLVTRQKKTKRLGLDTAARATVQMNLNNAYYLDHFFALCDTLNRAYPLQHSSFRRGFQGWKELPHKEWDHGTFRTFAHARLKDMKDSIGREQDRLVAATNGLLQNMATIGYEALKEGLSQLPAGLGSASGYYGAVAATVAKLRPEYFFRLAEDVPDHRSALFAAVERDKAVLAGLKAVEGHAEVKKEFFKERKFERSIPYRVIGSYAFIIGLVTLLIVSL